MIEQTEAIVLGARRFSESSKIVTLYTRNVGKMAVIAKGAMRPKNKFGASLQPFSYVSAVIYVKEGRDLQIISSSESVKRFAKISGDLDRMTAGLEIVELVNASVHGEDRNDTLFDATVAALDALNKPETDPAVVSLWFMSRLASALGYAVRVDGCGVCDERTGMTEDGGVAYSIPTGAPLCAEHRDQIGYRSIRRESFAVLEALDRCLPDDPSFTHVNRAVALELRDVLLGFLRYHVDGLRKLRVGGVASAMLG